MKKSASISLLLVLLFSQCGTKEKKMSEPETGPQGILEKVAYAHGFENWNKVKEIRFTFNVERDTTHFDRTWIWNTTGNSVTSMTAEDTLTYNRASMDSVALKANGGFINDKYWFLAPYNLIWDSGNIEHTHTMEAQAPISGETMQKLTITYGPEGGYTPGDAYDFYFGDDYIVKEWVFRRGNQPEPSMSTTWESYTDVDGLKIATEHKNKEGNFNLHFTDIEVVTK